MPGPVRPSLLSRTPRKAAALRGCLLGGAVGNALGAPVEFLDWSEIRQQFGAPGIRDFVPVYGQAGAITSDTQILLFTAEGLLRAQVRQSLRGVCDPVSVIHHALLRWLLTQGEPSAVAFEPDGWLFRERQLWSRRTPGSTTLKALRASRGFGERAGNDSRSCGGLLRAAPCAFFPAPFATAADAARLTHGHPAGFLPAGLFADLLARLWIEELPLADALRAALAALPASVERVETVARLEQVLALHAQGAMPTPAQIDRLAGGNSAPEVLATALWCALAAEDFESGLILAVNHSGDSDSVGLLAGQLLGVIHGPEAIPARWLAPLEAREIIEQLADDLATVPFEISHTRDEAAVQRLWARYPGW